MAARKDLSQKVRRLLVRRFRQMLGNGVRVHVERASFRDHIDVTVVSRKFAGKSWLQSGTMIWKWFQEELKPSEIVKIAGLIALTPAEERRLYGNGA